MESYSILEKQLIEDFSKKLDLASDEEEKDMDSDEQKERDNDLEAHKEKRVKRRSERIEKLHANVKNRYSYDQLVQGLKAGKYKQVCVCTGAGISVDAGIPDFRSPKTGLYDNLAEFELPKPESMFDIAYFKDKPEAFYKLAKDFLDLDKFQPTLTHYFIKLLQNKGILQINMTQNIDNLEQKAGLDMELRVV